MNNNTATTTDFAKEAVHQLDPQSWVAEYSRYLMHIALSKVDDYEVAEDLVQDTFVAAWKAHDRFRGECSEKTFLSGILRNKIIDYYRSRGRRPSVVASQLDSAEEDGGSSWLDSKADERRDFSPSSVVDRSDFVMALDRAVEKLPQKMGEAFRLWQIDDLSTDEVTERLGISRSNLWVLVHRAKKLLKAELGADWQGVSLA